MVASFPDSLEVRIALHHGKSVKSKIVVDEAPEASDANENYAEARLSA